ncbi:hypothetical protein GGR54DRAFT_513000 [Hypoxylon sp. NC1633]|nr:hypothetical protein GGR54DRAFT_513000 [Hypoxylon sp. NC1633]
MNTLSVPVAVSPTSASSTARSATVMTMGWGVDGGILRVEEELEELVVELVLLLLLLVLVDVLLPLLLRVEVDREVGLEVLLLLVLVLGTVTVAPSRWSSSVCVLCLRWCLSTPTGACVVAVPMVGVIGGSGMGRSVLAGLGSGSGMTPAVVVRVRKEVKLVGSIFLQALLEEVVVYGAM